MKNNFKFLIVLAILLAGCICVGSTFAADSSIDVTDVSSVDDTQNIEIAHDDSSQKDVEINNLQADEDSFYLLNSRIINKFNLGYKNYTLGGNYKHFINDIDVINITNHSVVIDGAGHTINADGRSGVFHISGNGVTIKNVISKIDNTYTGHYHNRSHREFVDGQTITYIGSPYQITRIDRGCERGYGVLDLDTNEFCWFDNKVSMRFNKFIYPNVDRDKIKGNVVDIYIPYALQTETKKIYDLVRELDGLFPAYPVNTFNESAPDNMQTDLIINNSNFNLLSMFPNYVEQIKDELPNTIKKEEIITELISLYNIFKGSEA